jgi:hypothetical protein
MTSGAGSDVADRASIITDRTNDTLGLFSCELRVAAVFFALLAKSFEIISRTNFANSITFERGVFWCVLVAILAMGSSATFLPVLPEIVRSCMHPSRSNPAQKRYSSFVAQNRYPPLSSLNPRYPSTK